MRPTTVEILICLCVAATGPFPAAQAGELWVGGATVSITPAEPVALAGQFHPRIARSVESPVTATALALERRDGDTAVDQAILVSCDLVAIRGTIQSDLRERLKGRLPGFDPRKLLLTATHSHTAPVMVEGAYALPREGVIQPAQYVDFLLERLAHGVERAWKARRPGGVSWALGHAVVGYNRRSVYSDGTAQMYGPVDRPSFRSFESGEDHGVELLYFWDGDEKLVAVAINVACPSQVVESRSAVSADFWHDVRSRLQERHSPDLYVLGWPGAAGDQSPHPMLRKGAEARMRTLRGLSETEEMARRIVREVEDALPLAQRDLRLDVPFAHHVEELRLPRRRITEAEVAAARASLQALSEKTSEDPGDHRRRLWHQAVLDRHRALDAEPGFEMELHVIRLGDIAIATNPFELFLDYGLQIKGRSPAEQTFILQLTGASGGYLPTREAVDGGGYSAVIESSIVGPAGGRVLVDETVKRIEALWR